jgi:hypothetical protein
MLVRWSAGDGHWMSCHALERRARIVNRFSWCFTGDGKHRHCHFLGGMARYHTYKTPHLPCPNSDCASHFRPKSWQQQDWCLLSTVNTCDDQFSPILLKAQKVMAQSTAPLQQTHCGRTRLWPHIIVCPAFSHKKPNGCFWQWSVAANCLKSQHGQWWRSPMFWKACQWPSHFGICV